MLAPAPKAALQESQAPSQLLSEREHRALVAVAAAAMPAGKIFPAAGERAVGRIEHFLGSSKELATGYRTILRALDANALLRYQRSLGNLTDEETFALIESWRRGDYARRTMIRLLTLPLKTSHYNDPEMYRQVGCRFGTLPVAQAERPRYITERTVHATDIPDGETLECDVVVVGSGAGGAACAKELAEKGHAVILLEEGEYFTRESFTGHSIEMQKKLYRDMGATVSLGNVSIPIPLGRGVGGTTLINAGTCFRAPERIFQSWQKKFGLHEFSADSMAPYYQRVEEVMQVTPAEMKTIGGVGRVIARGCDALGYAHAPLHRNAPACDGQGVCCFGCPTDAKRSTNVSYVPLALRAGAQLVTGAKVAKIHTQNGRATGVEINVYGKKFTVQARAVVVACGSLLTPLLLDANRLGKKSGQLGHNLSIHPAAAAFALYDEVIDGTNAIPQGYSIEEFHAEGLLFEGAFAPLDLGAASFPLFGKNLVSLLEQYQHLACFGFLLEDSSRGQVRTGIGGKPFIWYWLNDSDVARIKRGIEILSRVYFASGAKQVIPLVHGFDQFSSEKDLHRFRRADIKARDFELTAYHPLGTARMGVDPKTSVVDSYGQLHDTEGLYIADGSVVPTSPAVNPQMTIMALATRTADRISAQLGRTGN